MSAAANRGEDAHPRGQRPLHAVSGERSALAWQVLASIEDPEIPALTLTDLGVVRFVKERPDGVLEVGLSPTYTGCPAAQAIRLAAESALIGAGLAPVEIATMLSPAWTSAWITPAGRRKLEEYGIAPPADSDAERAVACPRCTSLDTERISRFGSTPCKALHRCRACFEPFEYFKCI